MWMDKVLLLEEEPQDLEGGNLDTGQWQSDSRKMLCILFCVTSLVLH